MKCSIGMCGDGANDCIALKQADSGISLSEAEASIAAPFTSQIQDISCVITLLREGRCALVTTFQAFKYIEIVAMIQFITVTMLYLEDTNLNDTQFTYIDICVLVPLCIVQTWTGSYQELTHNLPQDSLFSPPVILSVIGCSIIQFAF
jgi:cation-transporting ATPase 13A2